MTAGVVTVAGIKYAAGLYWQPSPEGNIARAARNAARQPGFQADFYCVRNATKSQPIGQFGLGISAAGHKAGMPSIAGCMANQMPGSWAGAFRVTEGVFFIVVRDDLVDADGDAWFAHDDDAQTRLEQEIARGGLQHIYAPPEWGVHGSEAGTITSILTGRRDVTLRAVSVSRSGILALLGLVLIAALAYGGYAYLQDQKAKRQAEEEAARQAEYLAKHPGATAVEYPRTWEDSPKPYEYITACGSALEKLRSTYLGWTTSSVECSGSSLSVSWSRGGSKGFAEVPADDKAVLDPALSSANTSVPLENLKPRGPEGLAHYQLIDKTILYHNWPVQLAAMPDDTVSVPQDSPPPPPPKWRKRSVSYTIAGAPWLRPELFDTIPGLIITAIKQSGDTNFTVEGIIYENKQPD